MPGFAIEKRETVVLVGPLVEFRRRVNA